MSIKASELLTEAIRKITESFQELHNQNMNDLQEVMFRVQTRIIDELAIIRATAAAIDVRTQVLEDIEELASLSKRVSALEADKEASKHE